MSQGKPLARVQAEADSARVKWISQTSASRVVRSKADRQLSAKIAHSASRPWRPFPVLDPVPESRH